MPAKLASVNFVAQDEGDVYLKVTLPRGVPPDVLVKSKPKMQSLLGEALKAAGYSTGGIHIGLFRSQRALGLARNLVEIGIGSSPKLEIIAAADEPAQYVQALRSARGGAITSAEAQAMLQMTRQALRDRRKNFTIVYWTDTKGQSHYPRWQFTPENHVHPDVKKILRFLATHDTTLVLQRFLMPFIGEPAKSVLELIEENRGVEAQDFLLNMHR